MSHETITIDGKTCFLEDVRYALALHTRINQIETDRDRLQKHCDELLDRLATHERAKQNGTERALDTLGREINAINKANGWKCLEHQEWELEYKVPAVLALIQSEVSEALEAFRHNDKANFIEELADTVIRVLDCTYGLGMDLDKAIREKLEKNKTRGFRHGGKRV